MNKNSFIFALVSLSLSFTVLPALAASPTEATEAVQLPAFVIKAERRSAAEKTIDRNLQQLRALAAKPVVVECPALPLKAHSSGTPGTKSSQVVVAGL